MSSDSQNTDAQMWKLVNEFTQRIEAGEKPSTEEYCRLYPELADEIRELFPTVQELGDLQVSEPSVDAADVPLPEQIGNYRILGEIGRGGMGVVYEAEHVTLGRTVALKVLPRRFTDDERALARFRREGQTIARLHHTNIVPLFEFGEDQGIAFLAMQRIQGHSLDHVIHDLSKGYGLLTQASAARTNFDSESGSSGSSGDFQIIDTPSPFSDSGTGTGPTKADIFRRIAHIGLQSADALSYAHKREIIHRDIKPSNLIFDESGVVWLTDFGLAKLEEDGMEASGMTRTGDMLGTLKYMAPERFEGQCDARADLYALGLTLFELLTQRPAFQSSNKVKLVSSIMNTEPDRPRSIDPQIPRDLETIVLKATNKERGARYQSAQEMAEDLRRFLADEPINARRVSWLEHTTRWARRNRALAASLALLATFLVVGLVGASLAAVRFAEQADRIEQDLYRAEMLLAGREVEQTGGISTIRALVRNWIPKGGEADRRGPEWHFYNGLGRDALQSFAHPKPVTAARFSPDDQRVATGDFDGSLRIWNANSGKLLQQIEAHEVIINDVAFSPDGKRVVTVSDDKSAKVWKVQSGELVCDLKGHSDKITSVAFQADGKRIASGAIDGLRFYDGKTYELIHHCTADRPASIPIFQMNWHPKKDRLLTISRDDTMLVWNPISGEIDPSWTWVNELPELEYWFGNDAIRWSPNADRILAIGHWSALIDCADGEAPQKGQVHSTNQSRCGGWSKDGKYFVLGGESLELLFFDAATQKEVGRIRGHEGILTDFCLDSAGTRILTASEDGSAKIWKYPELPQPEKHWCEGGLAISPDSKHAALSGGTRNEVLIANLKTQEIIGRFQSPTETWLGYVTWDPAGEKIAVASGNGETDSMVYVLDGSSGELLQTINPNSVYVQFLAWHPTVDGLLAVGQSTNQAMEFWDTQAGELVETQEFISWKWNAADWSPDGKWLAYAGLLPEVAHWQDRQIKHRFEDTDSAPTATQFSRDGKWLAIADNSSEIRYYETGTWKLFKTLTGHAGPVLELQWGPRGERLASIGSNGTMRLWNTASGKIVLSHALGARPHSLQWSEDGNTIAVSANKRIHVFDMSSDLQETQ